jgi:hypothetical protein
VGAVLFSRVLVLQHRVKMWIRESLEDIR